MNLLRLLNPTAEPTCKIIFTRSCTANGNTYQVGDEASFNAHTAADLISSGAGYDPSASNAAEIRAKHLESLLPPPVIPAELPEDWETLPAIFTDWHNLNASFQALATRQEQIWDILLPRMRRYTLDPDTRSIENQPWNTRNLALQGLAGGFNIGTIPDAHHREVSHLTDSYHRAEKACDDWKQSNSDELFRLRILCGDTVQKLHGDLCESIPALHQTGLDIFSLRIKALGLSDRKTSELYSGSADALKFSSFDQPSLMNLRLAYYEKGVGARCFIDSTVPTIVCVLRGFEQLLAKVNTATKEAKSELARASKAAA